MTASTQKHSMLQSLYKLIGVVKSNSWVVLGIGTIVSFVISLKAFLVATAALVVFDTVSGVMAARKRQEKITSRGFSRLIEKLVLYFSGILAAGLLQNVFFTNSKLEFLPDLILVYVVSASICVTEFLSLKENIETVTGVDILGGLKKNLKKLVDAIPRKEDLS